jgi:hypothetical protein
MPSEQGQPGYPPSGTVPPPPKKSKAGKIILIVLAVVLVLCGGGVAIAYFAVKDEVTGAVAAAQTRLVTPDTLAGRPRNNDPALQTLADTMVTTMKGSQPGATSTIGAFYGDPGKRDLLMIAGASALVTDPAKELDVAITDLGEGDLKITNVASVEPGPLGGVAKCGDVNAEGVPLGVCVWADHGSVGVIALYFKTGAQAQAEFVQIRGEVEKRE